MKIYNLFPLLAGPVAQWTPHLERAAAMGFDWIFVNPIQATGRSGSLYSIADYFAINQALIDPASGLSPEAQVRAMTDEANRLGLQVMVDLVVNHCAYDSDLIQQRPEWFAYDGGAVAHPYCVQGDGSRVVWSDLARFDHHNSADADGLWHYTAEIVDYLIGLGFTGFRCDAAYQIPGPFWHKLISRFKDRDPDLVFIAETLGCSPDQTRETAAAGFDAVFNSGKWWDFESPWLLEQYELTRQVAPSIGFPESHDTERLFSETNGNIAAMKQRYLFAGLFSSGVLMPIGFEYGFRRRLHVVETRPEHWEEPAVDLTGFITEVNRLKSQYQVFQEESLTQPLAHGNPAILLLWKACQPGDRQALIVLNKDPHQRQPFYTDDLYRYVQAPPPLRDVSPEFPQAHVPTPFSFDLEPGMARVFVTGSSRVQIQRETA